MARSHFISVSRQPATSRWPTLSTKACLFIITVLLAANGAGVTLAEDWPGWRKDGSGVSNETGIPQSWDPEHNIVWKTLVPGEGISSPIAWRDRIFITSVEPGTIRHVAYHSYRALLCLLTLAALWWYVEGTPADPLGPRRSAERLAPTVGTIAGKAMRVTLFVGVAYAVLVACEQLRDCYPSASSWLDKPWRRNGHNSRQISVVRFWISSQPGDNDRLEINPQIPRDCFLAGFLGAFAVLGMNGFVASPRRTARASSSPGLLPDSSGVATWVQAVLVSGIAGTFVVAATTYSVVEPPHANTTTWYQTANLCLLGLIAAVGSFPRESSLRALGAGVVLLVLAGLMVHALAPGAPSEWHEDVWATHFPVYWEVTLATCSQFYFEHLRSRRRAEETPSRPRLGYLGPWAILLGCIVLFIPANYFLPTSVLLRQLVCIDRDSGAIRWVTTCAAAPNISDRWASAPATLATPTAVTDGEYVYAHFGGAGAHCVDFSGRLVWSYNDPVPPAHWTASSPVLWQDLLILTYDVDKRSLTVALDKSTGTARWEADRTTLIKPMNYFLLDAYSTPLVVERRERSQLVSHSNFYLCGYDLSTGKEIWHVRTPCGQVVPSPVRWNDTVIVPGGASNKFLLSLQLQDRGPDLVADEVWRDNRQAPEISSPVVYGDHLYAVTPFGVATCRAASNKEMIWKERVSGQCDSSVTAADGKIYFCDINGVTTVVAAGPPFTILARNVLGEPVQASFAISGGSIFIRGNKHLFCIGTRRR